MKSSKEIVESYIQKKDWRVNESSSAPFCFGAMNKYMSAEVSKDYWLRGVYPEYISKAYVDGHIHIHDLGGLTLYCTGYSLKDIILKGVRGVPNIPVSAPAKHFDSILNQCSNLVTVFQNEIMGAVAFNGFDTLLAPFVKNERLGYKEVKQSIQNFVFSVNSNSRAGAEPAFFNLTFDITPPADMMDEYCIIGGNLVSFTYGSCQQEMDLINRVFFDVMLEGDANGKLFSYPIPTYNIHSRFDWNNPNNKMLWEMAGKYGTPYFANFINSDLDISDVRSMCPMSGDTRILYYNVQTKKWDTSDIKDIWRRCQQSGSGIIKVIANGRIVNCRVNQFDESANYTITLSNNAQIKTTANHLNKVLRGSYIKTKDLTTDDYIPVYRRPITVNDNMTYEDGKLIGMFLGDGSYENSNGVVFSLNRESKQHLIDFIYDYCPKRFGARIREYDCVSEISGLKSCVNVYVTAKSLRGLIEQFVNGTNALTKSIDESFVDTSEMFRRGIIDGVYETDGGNNNRIYTSSTALVESLTELFATLGIPVVINEDNRPGRLGTNTCYTVRYYDIRENRTKYGDVYMIDDSYVWFKVKNISINNDANKSYCLEVLDEDAPEEFMLANGIVTHNCRLRLNLKELRHKNGGLFGAGDSTGSIGVVTINLPRIAYESGGDKDRFFEILDKYLNIAKDSLEYKREWLQKNILDTNAIPAYMEYVGTIDRHFSTIGVVGMNEMCENFMHKNILDADAKQFCLDVGNHIREKLVNFQEETGHLYNYEATPAESTCYRLALIDKHTYPDIYTQGDGDDVYYTNSCHIPVNMIKDINSTFEHQNELQAQFTGGTVIHCYLNGAIPGEHAKAIVKGMFESYKVPYMSLSPISRYCDEHGYVAEITDTCPRCGKRLKMYQRITGYLRCVDNFNKGKKAEFEDRVQL